MAIEVREERPAERRFIVTMPTPLGSFHLIGARQANFPLTEPELRELVEKGAGALGAEPMSFSLMFNAAAYQEEAKKREVECTRLRAWLKAIVKEGEAVQESYTYPNGLDKARRALAGEEAPTP